MGISKWFKNLINRKNVLYSSAICSDCQQAEAFFDQHDIEIEIKKIEESQYREELEQKHGKVLVPTIILGNDKFIGFANNKEEIERKLGLS